MSRRRGWAAIGLGIVAASTLLGGSARADEGSTLAGYQGRAAASGLHAFYNPEGLLPVGSLVDVGAPDALATVASGPTTFARASIADPGDILANPDAVLALADPSYPTGSVPPYPYRVSATSGAGEPRAESNPAPGLSARVEAGPGGSTARATGPAADAPKFASVGAITSLATTVVEDSSVTAHARTQVSGFDLFGIVKIESVVSDVEAVATGATPKLTGGTTITGVTVLDKPATIDASGLHVDGADALGQRLADAGIRITLPGRVAQAGGTAGQLAATGLRVDIEVSQRTAPLLSQLADLLPSFDNPLPGAPSADDLAQLLRAKHVTALEVGGATVSLSATKATDLADVGDLDVGAPLDGVTGAPVGFDTLGAAPGAVDAGRSAAVRPSLAKSTPGASIGAGIGALALLALLAQPFAGARLARGVASVLAADDADTCPREAR